MLSLLGFRVILTDWKFDKEANKLTAFGEGLGNMKGLLQCPASI